MSEENILQKERFLQEVEQKLLRKELDARLLEDGLVHVSWNEKSLCSVDRDGIVRFRPADITGAEENVKIFKKHVRKYKIFEISALTGDGTEELVKEIVATLKTLPAYEPEGDSGFTYAAPKGDGFSVEEIDDGVFEVTGNLVKTLERNVVLNDTDSMAYMQKTLRDKGVIKALRNVGAKDGDTVVIGDVEFDFVE